jgi:hypothetical protein
MCAMKRRVLIVGHSDADGHVIAEQTRRNLNLIPSFEVTAVVDPKRTQGHKSWEHLQSLYEVDDSDLIVFIDLMFSPTSFAVESEALLQFVSDRPNKTFFVIDHHPLPERRLATAPNIRAVYRPNVFDCTLGPRSGMMILAAICEHQRRLVSDICRPYHDVLATGLRRAAAPGGGLAGTGLMNLLGADRWDALYALGTEQSAYHRFVRGKRIVNGPLSEGMVYAERAASAGREAFLYEKVPQDVNIDSEAESMPFDLGSERFVLTSHEPPHHTNTPVPTRDLETLVTLLEFAAVSLTRAPGAEFSCAQLIEEAREIGGSGMDIDERDVKCVLDKASFLESRRGKLSLR